MELIVESYDLPEKIDFNFEQIKQELTEKVSKYETLQYGEEEVKEAKKDRAALNKLKSAIKEERLRREREYMKPFDDFKQKINEIVMIIDKPINLIDKQLDEYENKRRADKRVEIGSIWERMERPEWLVLSKIFDEKWLNATVSIKSITSEIEAKLAQIRQDTATIESLEEFSFEAMDTYKRTLDLGMAIAEGKRLADIQKRKEEQAKAKAEAEERAKEQEQKRAETVQPVDMSPYMPEPTKEPAQWVKFGALLTVDQAKALKAFFESNKIEFRAIKEV